MSRAIDLDLLETIYDVPLGACGWREVMSGLQRTFCADVGILLALDGQRKDIRGLSINGVDATTWQQYREHYAKINPFLDAIESGRARPGRAVLDAQLISRRAFERTEFYDGYWRACRLGASAGGYLRDARGNMLVLALPRLRGRSAYAETDLAPLEVYFGHIARALQMQREIESRRGEPDLDAVARRYGLSCAEHRLVATLIETGSLRKSAARLHRSHNTLRAQLRSILQKTGMRSQVELMAFIHGR